jgi:glycosyltransferase involved in cell wall biosynthesis
VVTLYDMAPIVVPETLDRMSRSYVRMMFAVGVATARCVCTISHAVSREILTHYPSLTAERVFVAYPGPNPELLQAEPRPPSDVDGGFLLMVGTLEPRKNHITVLRALVDHVRRRPSSPLRLILAGPLGWRYTPILLAIDELGLTSRVIRLGAIDVGILKWLYLHAQALVFPSLYEGFGIPVLEAFSLECPVVAARIPSVIELAGGDAALLLDPTDVQAWASAMDEIADGRVDGSRRAAGLARSREFTWEGCARGVLAAVHGAVSLGSH